MFKRVSFILTAVLTALSISFSTATAVLAEESVQLSAAELQRAEKELKSAETNYRNASAEYAKAKSELEIAAAEKERARSEYERITAGLPKPTSANPNNDANMDSLLQNQQYRMETVTEYGFVYVEAAETGLKSGGLMIADGEVPLAGLPIMIENQEERVMHFPWILCGILGVISAGFYLFEKAEMKRAKKKNPKKK